VSDYVKHKGPWMPGMMVIDHGRSRRGRVWKVLDGDPLVLVCHSAGNGTRWNVLVGPWLSADISDETTRRLMDSLKADGGAS